MPEDFPFDHVVLTRFSVQMGMNQTFPDEWLDYRWNFFQDALLASMRSQTVPHFTWLVFFDQESPDWLRERIEATRDSLFIPVFNGVWTHEAIRDEIVALTSRPYLITTRIDSDDAASRYFVEDIQAQFDHQESLYVNFMRGVQVDRSLQLFHASFAENAFISYIEKRVDGEPPRTVFQCFPHEESSSFAPVRNIVGPVRWMQVIHGSNVANSIRGLRAYPNRIATAFDVDIPFTTHIGFGQFATEWTRSATRLIRLWIRHPTFALVYFRALKLRVRGTTTVPVHVHRESRLTTTLRSLWRRFHHDKVAP